MRSVSRERSTPASVVGPSATAASRRARAVSDLEPGRATVASRGPRAAGAGQGPAGDVLMRLSCQARPPQSASIMRFRAAEGRMTASVLAGSGR